MVKHNVNCAVGSKKVKNMRPGCAAKSGFVWSWHTSSIVKSNTAFSSYTAKASNLARENKHFQAVGLFEKQNYCRFSSCGRLMIQFIIYFNTSFSTGLRYLSCATINGHLRDSKFFSHYNTPVIISKWNLFFFTRNILDMDITGENDHHTLQNQQGLWHILLVTGSKCLYLQ